MKATEAECKETILRLKTDKAFRRGFIEKFECLKRYVAKPMLWQRMCESSLGNDLVSCKNVFSSFGAQETEDSCYVYELTANTDCCDTTRSSGGELLYECGAVVGLRASLFCNLCYYGSDLIYCDNCFSGALNCFGSISLKKHKHCILNKQYSVDEYASLVSRIVQQMRKSGEWGEFFPLQLSPFCYNETKAHTWWPVSEKESKRQGLSWKEPEEPPQCRITDVESLATFINSDVALNAIVKCSDSGRPFRFGAVEIEFYRKKGLSLPSVSREVRHSRRTENAKPQKLVSRDCEYCREHDCSVYPGTNCEAIFCSKCYESTAGSGQIWDLLSNDLQS